MSIESDEVMHKVMESVSLKVAGVPETLRCFYFSLALVLTIGKKIVGMSYWLLKVLSSHHNLSTLSESVLEDDLSES